MVYFCKKNMKNLYSYLKRSKLILLLSITSSGIYAQSGNIGFESGTTAGWTCGSGTFGKTKVTDCKYDFPILVNYDGNCLNQGGTNGTTTPGSGRENRHTLISSAAGTDPNTLGGLPCLAPSSMFPGGINNYSFRLGNAITVTTPTPTPYDSLSYAEGIKFKLHVDSTNTGLTYLYALLMKESIPEIHPQNQGPRFIVKVLDSLNNIIDCNYKLFVLGPSGPKTLKSGLQDGIGLWKYSDWEKVQLNLSAYIGQQITVEFITADCFPASQTSISSTNGKLDTVCSNFMPGAHSAYAYIDMYYEPYKAVKPAICALKDTIQLCAPEGYATYNWPANQTGIQPPLNKQCVSIIHPKEGEIYTVNATAYAGVCSTPFTFKLQTNDFILNDTAVCKDNAIQLNAVPVVNGNYDFKWEPQTNLDQYDVPNPIFTAGVTTTYTVTMANKDMTGCDKTKKVNVFVKEKIEIFVTDTTIHQGDTVRLNGNVSGVLKAVWVGGQGTFIPNRFALNGKYVPTSAEEVAGMVQLTLESADSLSPCPKASKVKNITIIPVISGITTAGNNLSIQLYPNPMNTELTIVISGLGNSASTELKLVDFLGREVRSQKLKNGSQKFYRENLPNGIYFMEIIDGGKSLQKRKIVIND